MRGELNRHGMRGGTRIQDVETGKGSWVIPMLAHRARRTHEIVIEAGGARCMRAVGNHPSHSKRI